jgi:amino acid adenylation domain-containing protein
MIQEKKPLSPIQQHLWFLHQLNPQAQDNIVSLACQIPETSSHEDLQLRLSRLIEACGTLRTVFDASGEQVTQQVLPNPESFNLHVAKLDGGGIDVKSANLHDHILHARQAVSDYACGPLFRVDLLLASNNSNLLLLTASRLVSDANSLEQIARYLLDPSQIKISSMPDFANPTKKVDANYGHTVDMWVQKLQDATHVCELPLDWTRPTTQQGKTSGYFTQLSSDVIFHLDKLARDNNASRAVVLMAAYFVLLYRYTFQDDILVGLAQRHAATDAPVTGPFTDTVVVGQKFTEGVTFAQLLTSLSTANTDATMSSPPPFSMLLDALNPERDPSRAPVVQHGFEFLDSTFLPLSNLPRVKRIFASATLPRLDLMLTVCAEKGGASVDWHYDPAIFSVESIQRIHRHFEVVIASVADNVDKPVTQLSLMTPEENELVTVKWNDTNKPVNDRDFVYRLFEKQAVRTPNAIAAREPGHEITYEALNRRANRMAHYLSAQGIGADNIVSILADRDIDYLTTILAINKAGAAFLPLSPTYPARRLASIFEKSETPLVLVGANYLEATQEAVQYLAPGQQPKITVIASVPEQENSETNLPVRCEMHHLAYVMFTSGSTGEPKGVMVHHAGNINHIYAKVGDLEMGPSDILAQTSRQSFDIVVWQFLAPLILGGSIYIMPDEIALDPAQLLKESNQQGVTILQLVPVNIEALLDVADAMAENRPLLKTLRWMVPTGDALATDLCRRWLGLYPHTRMLNTYGATECSDDQCHHVIASSPPAEYRPAIMTIGRPIINTQVYILDDGMQPVPVGVIGELYITGIGVGRGYLKEPERTARTFVPNPFSDGPRNSLLYRSGDQARYLPDGTIEFLGRIGHMIKIRGMRIEPGEIQSVLGRHPQVAQATLTVNDFLGLGTHLISYIVFRKGEVVSESDLRIYLRQYLPEYMIPSYFVAIDALPLNANGKIDRKALPIPDITGIKSTVVAPRNETEKILFNIWSRILNRDELSIRDNFFDIGGHSLLAMQLFSQIERQFGQRLPLKTILSTSTIADLAELLTSGTSYMDTSQTVSELSCIVPIQVGNPERPPFFFLHAAGGHVVYIRKFASLLAKEQPFYGIQAVGIDDNREPLNRFEDLAAAYVQQIRIAQPEGPYYLGGESMGATISFEVVRQLEEQGQVVGLLAMFDASFCAGVIILKPGVPMWLYEIIYNLKRLWRLHLPILFNASWEERKEYISNLAHRVTDTLRRIFFGYVRQKTTSSDPALKVIQTALLEAQAAYRPGFIRTLITLFSSELPWGAGDETLGWRTHSSGGVDILRFPTLFDTMLEGTHAKLVADRLQEILDRKFAGQNDQRVTNAH